MTRLCKLASGSHAAFLSLAVLAVLLAGCKTDSLVNPERQSPQGPVTDLETPAGFDLPSINITQRAEADLVEELILHRAMYARFLRALVTYYTEHGDSIKASWAQSELNGLRRIKPYTYIRDAEIPVASLEPAESIAEADKLYENGLTLMKKGGHGIPALYNQETMKKALATFKELVDNYSSSDKIDDAAFWIAEIYKEYMEEKDNYLAMEWYQRAIDWNPETPHPVRFQMAVLLDYRMHEREKALAMYQEVLKHEQSNKSNLHWAHVRIGQLTTEKTRHAPGEAVEDLPPSGEPGPGNEPPVSPPAPELR